MISRQKLHENPENGNLINRRDAMNIEVNDEFKFAVVWLTNEEKENQQMRENLKPLMAEYKQRKYKFVIMESGKQDLLELTKGLLNHNKNLVVNNS